MRPNIHALILSMSPHPSSGPEVLILPSQAANGTAEPTRPPPRRQRFLSDNEGVLRIVTESIYKQPQEVVIREYLQNCLDAHAARRALDPGFRGKIVLELLRLSAQSATLTFADEGIGLAPDKVDAALGTIA